MAFDPGEVDLGIEQGRVLPLGVGALTTEGGEAATMLVEGRPPATMGSEGRPGMEMALSPMESENLPALVRERPRRASTTLLAPMRWV